MSVESAGQKRGAQFRIEERFEVACAQERAYREINDVGHIAYCIAGVKQVEVVSDTQSRLRIEQRIGFMARTFKLEVQLLEPNPPRHIAFRGTGQDVEITGGVTLDRIDDGHSGCTADVQVRVTGPLAPLVDLMAKGPQEALIRQTVANLRTRLEEVGAGRTPGNAPPPAATPSARSRSLRAWLRDLATRLRKRSKTP